MGLWFKNELYKKKKKEKSFTPGGLLQTVKTLRLKKYKISQSIIRNPIFHAIIEKK